MIALSFLIISMIVAYIIIPSEEQIMLKVRKLTENSVAVMNLERLYNPNAFMYYIDKFGLRSGSNV